MSSSGTTQTINTTVENFNGGSPTRDDLIPAIIFSVVIALTIPLLIWRLVSKKHRSRILANAVGFMLIRLASLIMRAIMSRRDYGPSTLIAEAILTVIGYLPLLNALIDLWQTRAERRYNHDETVDQYGNHIGNHNRTHNVDNTVDINRHNQKVKWVKYTGWFLRFLLLAAFATAIAAAAILRKNYSDQEQVNVIRNLLKASYIVSLAITAISMILKIVTAISHGESLRKVAIFYLYSIPLLIVSIYKVVEVFTGYRASTRWLAAFWVAMILFEVVAYSVLLAMSIPKYLSKVIHHHHDDAEKRALGSSGASQTASGTHSYPASQNAASVRN